MREKNFLKSCRENTIYSIKIMMKSKNLKWMKKIKIFKRDRVIFYGSLDKIHETRVILIDLSDLI